MNVSSVFYYLSRIHAKGMTLPLLRAIEDEVFLKTDAIGYEKLSKVCEAIEEVRELLKEKDLVHLQVNSGSLTEKIAKLYLEQNFLAPSEMEEAISFLQKDEKRQNKALNGLEFQVVEPLAREFNPRVLESTFMSRMEWIAREVVEQNSIDPYTNYLTEAQQNEIARFGGEGVSPEVLRVAIKEYLSSLRGQVDVAQDFYFGREQEGLKKLLNLPNAVRQRIFQQFVSAMLQGVEEQMGVNEGG